MPFLSCLFPCNTKYSVLILYARSAKYTARGPHAARENFARGLQDLSQLQKILHQPDLGYIIICLSKIFF